MIAFPWTAKQVLEAGNKRGFPLWKGEYDLNLWGIRTDDNEANTFNDWICVFHRRNNMTWAFYALQATTDPGTYYRENPANYKGTAILPPGYYRGMWKLGKHRQKYDALVQNKPITVWRDSNKDTFLEAGTDDTGMFGINLHRANSVRSSARVDKWSAGCQVVAAPEDLDLILDLMEKQVKTYKCDTVSYGLLVESDID